MYECELCTSFITLDGIRQLAKKTQSKTFFCIVYFCVVKRRKNHVVLRFRTKLFYIKFRCLFDTQNFRENVTTVNFFFTGTG